VGTIALPVACAGKAVSVRGSCHMCIAFVVSFNNCYTRSEDTHLHAVLPAREAEMCPPASCRESLRRSARTRRLRREFRHVHQQTIQSAHQTTEDRACEHSRAIDRPHPPIERSKVLERPSSRLPLRAACAFHPTDEFDARRPPPSVRSQNLRIQESSHHKGSLGSTSRISSLLTSMRVCVR
jgi:hypothetical protein